MFKSCQVEVSGDARERESAVKQQQKRERRNFRLPKERKRKKLEMGKIKKLAENRFVETGKSASCFKSLAKDVLLKAETNI